MAFYTDSAVGLERYKTKRNQYMISIIIMVRKNG